MQSRERKTVRKLLWLLYVISSAFFFCLGNVAEKILVNKYVKNSTFYGYTLITFLIYGLIAFFLFPFASFDTITPFILLLIIARTIENLLFYYFWIKLMMDEEISRIVGILFLYPLITFFLDYLLFKTQLSVLFYIGSLMMIISALLMSYKPSKKIFVEKKHIFYLIMIIILWGIYGILLKAITIAVDIPTFLFFETASALIISIIIISLSKTIQKQITEFFTMNKIFWLAVVGVTILYLSALLLSFKAYSLQKVSLVASFETIQPTFVFITALLLSLFFPEILKEEIDKKTIIYKIIALALLIVGVWLVSFNF
ncbi:EamA family transporter [Candidatus Woesearchaeota archaeon]|nr:EamA family transporter [Candidatus Woesearchaeota archaeon]